MRILKREVQGLHEDEPESSRSSGAPGALQTPAEITTAPQPDQQSQIDALQQQVRDLQRAAAMDADPRTPSPAGAAAESQPSQQSR
jgi:hypothetical protein